MSEGTRPGGLTALAVLNFVFGGFGVVSTSMALGGAENNPPLVVGLAILAVGIAAAAALVFTVRSLRRIRSAPLSAFVPVAVFDRSDGTYRDGVGQVVGRLDQVRFEKRMQIGSSSPKLVAVTPHGAYVLKRGNPFGGHIHGMDAVLSTAIFGDRR